MSCDEIYKTKIKMVIVTPSKNYSLNIENVNKVFLQNTVNVINVFCDYL